MKLYPIYLALCLLYSPFVSASVDSTFMQGLGDSRYTKIESISVGRSYHLYIKLPDGYEESSEKYPTIYLLDGGALFPMLSAYHRYLNFGGEVPDAIIVGISYGTVDPKNGNFRGTDYTAKSKEREYYGGAAKFQQFLVDELIPYIESTYRSRADRRIIFGQSIGGQFVLYTALTDPTLFWGHIASNPALHRNLPFFLQDHAESVPLAKRSRLFVANGSMNDARFQVPALEWIDYWVGRGEKPWMLKTMILEGESHMSAPPSSFRQGMHWLFSSGS
jgi:predicted alpha/beta superfamily hydrolase